MWIPHVYLCVCVCVCVCVCENTPYLGKEHLQLEFWNSALLNGLFESQVLYKALQRSTNLG